MRTTITFDQINNLDLGPSKYFNALEDAYGSLEIGTPIQFSEICKNIGLEYAIYALVGLPKDQDDDLKLMCCKFVHFLLNKLDEEVPKSYADINFLRSKVNFVEHFTKKEMPIEMFMDSKQGFVYWKRTYAAANFKNQDVVNLITCLHQLEAPKFSISHHLNQLKDEYLEELIIEYFG